MQYQEGHICRMRRRLCSMRRQCAVPERQLLQLRCVMTRSKSKIENYGFLAAVTLFEKVLQPFLARRCS